MLWPSHSRISQRGLALLSAVLIALILNVVARGILQLQLGKTSQQSQLERRARLATVSGLEYAKSQLAKDTDWRGSDPRGTTVDNAHLTVKEKDGAVIGLMRFRDGGQAQFRIRFNAQDGTGGVDDMGDPSQDFFVDNQQLSLNNLSRSSQAVLPKVGANFKASSSETDGKVPGRSVLIKVEGRAGPGVDELTKAQPNSTLVGHATQVNAEALLKARLPETSDSAVLQTAGDFHFSGQSLSVASADSNTPSIRSKRNIQARTSDGSSQASLLMEGGGKVYCAGGESGLDAAYDAQQVTVGEELPETDFLQLSWDQVDKPSQAFQLNAGVYVLWPPVSSGLLGGSSELHYYDMSYEKYITTIHNPMVESGQLPSDPGVIVNTNFSNTGGTPSLTAGGSGTVEVNGNVLTISTDLKVNPTARTSDFAVIPLSDAPLKPEDPKAPEYLVKGGGGTVEVRGGQPLTINITGAKVQTQGDFVLKGAVLNVSDATLIGEKNLILNTSTLSVSGSGSDETNLSLYFKNDVTMSTLTSLSTAQGQTSNYGDFSIAGTIYSWGDISADTGGLDGGAFDFRGTLVAYGGNPEGAPGSDQRGRFNLRARAATLTYDPTTSTQIIAPEDLGSSIVFTASSVWVR